MNTTKLLADLAGALAHGEVTIVDCSAVLGPQTPVLKLPPEIADDTPAVEIHKISEYGDRGPYWAWNWLKLGEHTGTHFDAPKHWITGRDFADGTTDTIPPQNFVAPVNVIDCSAEAETNPDFLLTRTGIEAWEVRHGAINPGEWVLMRTDWDRFNDDADRFLNADAAGPHTPGPSVDCIQYLMERGVLGWGTQCIGTDAGAAGCFDPPYPAHNLLHLHNRYGLASLTNLDKLPPKGAILIAAPLKIQNGTGSPVRALALVPGA